MSCTGQKDLEADAAEGSVRADAEPCGTYGFLTARHRRDCARFNLRDCSRGQACPLKSGRFRSDDTEFGFSWKRPRCLVTSVMMTCGPSAVQGGTPNPRQQTAGVEKAQGTNANGTQSALPRKRSNQERSCFLQTDKSGFKVLPK